MVVPTTATVRAQVDEEEDAGGADADASAVDAGGGVQTSVSHNLLRLEIRNVQHAISCAEAHVCRHCHTSNHIAWPLKAPFFGGVRAAGQHATMRGVFSMRLPRARGPAVGFEFPPGHSTFFDRSLTLISLISSLSGARTGQSIFTCR